MAHKGCIPWNKGIKYSEDLKSRLNIDGLKLGHGWNKGKMLVENYGSIHYWIRKTKGLASICENCGSQNKCEWANISGQYLKDPSDYKSLCKSCHTYFDREPIRLHAGLKFRGAI